MPEYSHKIKIPADRIAVLIGKSGEMKDSIEEAAKIKLNIDSKEGDVELTGDNPLVLYSALNLVRAVGRGFNPNIAMLLLKPDYSFEVINLNDFVTTQASLLRLKGRVIGMDGKSRRVIEELTECFISVYGKTVAIIGHVEYAGICRKAVVSLLEGSMHKNVFKWLEKQRRARKKDPEFIAEG